MREPYIVSSDSDQRADARVELLVTAVAEVPTRAWCYLQQPDETAWHDVVQALAACFGDSAAYELLRAVEIHSRSSTAR